MSTSRLQVIHYDKKRCKHSESVELKINKKTLISPVFAPRLKNSTELDIYLDVKSTSAPSYISAYVVRLVDVGKTLSHRLRTVKQRNLLGESADPIFSSNLEQDLILIDPAFEYLYYSSNMDRLIHSPNVSSLVRDYAKDFITKKDEIKHMGQKAKTSFSSERDVIHTNFWSCMYKEPQKRMKLIRDTFTQERKNHADLFIPPVPIITSKHLLKVALTMNDKSQAYAEGKMDCADYFILKSSVLTNESMMDTIKQYIQNSPSPLTIFKFKNLNLNNEDCSFERRAFKELLEELSFLSKHIGNKAFAFFDTANQTFVSALSSVAIVSTSFNLDREDYRHSGGTQGKPYASWFDPEKMTLQNQKKLATIVKNNNGKIPCYCPVCSASPTFLSDGFIEYNRKVKGHFLHVREQEMKEICDAIDKQDALMGFDKINRSALKNLTEVIPR